MCWRWEFLTDCGGTINLKETAKGRMEKAVGEGNGEAEDIKWTT